MDAIENVRPFNSGRKTAEARRATMGKTSIFDLPALEAAAENLGIKPLHCTKVLQTAVRLKEASDVSDIVAAIPGLPKVFGNYICDHFVMRTTTLIESQEAKDRSAVKLLIELRDESVIEAVIMRYGHDDDLAPVNPNDDAAYESSNTIDTDHADPDSQDDINLVRYVSKTARKRLGNESHRHKGTKARSTLCVSSQVGCRMACGFCATGTMGLLSSLTSGEIVEQLVHAMIIEPIRNVVFMGMGEPLDNYEEVLKSVQVMTESKFFALAPAHVTVSTVGVPEKILRLVDDFPTANLALSLHAPTQELREIIVPTSKTNPLNEILDACHLFVTKQQSMSNVARKSRCLLLQYCLIEGINDSSEIADQLADLLESREGLKKYARLNVIPYNQTDTPLANKLNFQQPSRETIVDFYVALKARGVDVFIRQEKGADIAAACGQLVVERRKKLAKTSSGHSDTIEGTQDEKKVETLIKEEESHPPTAPSLWTTRVTQALEVFSDSVSRWYHSDTDLIESMADSTQDALPKSIYYRYTSAARSLFDDCAEEDYVTIIAMGTAIAATVSVTAFALYRRQKH